MSVKKMALWRLLSSYIEEINFYELKQPGTGSPTKTLQLLPRLIAKIFSRIYQKIFFVDQWYLLIDVNKDLSMSFEQFKKVLPPKDRFWADPMVVQTDHGYHIFVEEYLFNQQKGHISRFQVDQQGNIEGPFRVLEKEYHLSYPFVFKWGEKYYMVPESAQNRTISLYESVDFPGNWKFKLNLMENIAAADTTLFHYQDKWWLFTGIPPVGGSFPFAQLHLFYSSDLFSGQWCPHPQNPVVADIKKARPAGSLFVSEGKIFRPSQDCSKMYGYGIYLNEIKVLSESKYSEQTVISIKPEWDKKVKATHTFGREGQLTVIDAFMRRSKYF